MKSGKCKGGASASSLDGHVWPCRTHDGRELLARCHRLGSADEFKIVVAQRMEFKPLDDEADGVFVVVQDPQREEMSSRLQGSGLKRELGTANDSRVLLAPENLPAVDFDCAFQPVPS